MNVFSLFGRIGLDDQDYRRSLQQVEQQTGQSAKQMENRWSRSLRSIEQQLNRTGQSMQRIGGTMSRRLTAPLLAIGGAAAAAATQLGNTADELLDLEQQTGLTTDTLQEFRRVSREAGVGQDVLASSAEGMARRLRAAGDESATFRANIESLGIETRQADGSLRSMDELLPEIITELQGMDDITTRNSVAMQIFGRRATELAPILGMTAEETNRLRQEARDMGEVMERDSLVQANEFRIAVADLGADLQVVGRDLVMATLPALERFADLLREHVVPGVRAAAERIEGIIDWFNELGPVAQRAIGIAVVALGAGGPFLVALGAAMRGVSALIGTIRTLRTAMMFMGPGGLIFGAIAAVGGLAAAFFGRRGSLEHATSEAIDRTSEARQMFRDAGGDVDQLRGTVETLSGHLEGSAQTAWQGFADTAIEQAERAQAAGKSVGDLETSGSVMARVHTLARELEGDARDAFINWAAQAIGSAKDVDEMAQVLEQAYARIDNAAEISAAQQRLTRLEMEQTRLKAQEQTFRESMGDQRVEDNIRGLERAREELDQAIERNDQANIEHWREQVQLRQQMVDQATESNEAGLQRLLDAQQAVGQEIDNVKNTIAELQGTLVEVDGTEVRVEPTVVPDRDSSEDATPSDPTGLKTLEEDGVDVEVRVRTPGGPLRDALGFSQEESRRLRSQVIQRENAPRDVTPSPSAGGVPRTRVPRPDVSVSGPTEAEAQEMNRREAHLEARLELDLAHHQKVLQADREAFQERRRLWEDESDQMLSNWRATVENLARAGRETSEENQQAAAEASERTLQAARESGHRIAVSMTDATEAGIEAEFARMEASAEASAQSLKNFQTTLENLARAGREGAAENAAALEEAREADLAQLTQDMENFGASIENLARAGREAATAQREAEREIEERLDRIQKRRAGLESEARWEQAHAAAEELGSQHERAADRITASNEALARLNSSFDAVERGLFSVHEEVMTFGQGLEDLAQAGRQAAQSDKERLENIRQLRTEQRHLAAREQTRHEQGFSMQERRDLRTNEIEAIQNATTNAELFGEEMLSLATENIPLLGSVLDGLAQGGPLGALANVFGELLGKSEGFADLMETLGRVLQPVINVLDGFFGAINRVVGWIFGIPDQPTGNQDPAFGSIAAKQQEIQVAQDAFERATTESSREFYRELIERLEGELEDMREGVHPARRGIPEAGPREGSVAAMQEELRELRERRDRSANEAVRADLNQQIADLQDRISEALEEGLDKAGEDMGETISGKIAELEEERSQLLEERDRATTEEQIANFNQQIAKLEEELRRLRALGMEEAEAAERDRRAQGFGGTPQAVQLAVATPIVDASIRLMDAGELFNRAIAPLVGGDLFESFSPKVQEFGSHIDRFGEAVDRLNDPGVTIRVHEQESRLIRRTAPMRHLRTTI